MINKNRIYSNVVKINLLLKNLSDHRAIINYQLFVQLLIAIGCVN